MCKLKSVLVQHLKKKHSFGESLLTPRVWSNILCNAHVETAVLTAPNVTITSKVKMYLQNAEWQYYTHYTIHIIMFR